MPDDHPNSMGAIGFMRHDYPNFGFDDADAVIAVGYELQEFDPAKINPRADKKIIHIHRFPAEVDAHYPVDVGIIGDISASLDALTEALAGHALRRRHQGTRGGSARRRAVPRANRIRAIRLRRNVSSPTPGRRSAAATSCSSTPEP